MPSPVLHILFVVELTAVLLDPVSQRFNHAITNRGNLSGDYLMNEHPYVAGGT